MKPVFSAKPAPVNLWNILGVFRLEDVENGATCLEIGMKIPKIVLDTFNGKGRIKVNVFVLIPFPTLIWD